MPFLWNHSKALIAGGSGSGKTELALSLLRGAKRFMIVDSNLEIAMKLNLKYTRQLRNWSPDVPVYYPSDYTVMHLEAIMRKARSYTNFCLLIDDLDIFSAGQYYIGRELNNAMINIRHQNIGMILTVKRIVNMTYLVPQNSHFVYLFNVPAQDFDALQNWNRALNYSEGLDDFLRLATHTFGVFEPADSSNRNATDPKRFAGFFKLPEKKLLLKT
jgi:hypothetical protein